MDPARSPSPRHILPPVLGPVFRAQRALPENVRALSWVSCANDFSSELIYPIVPLFLRSLGASFAVIGLIEGLAEGVAVGLRGIAGWLSDRWGGRRLPWVAGGYGAAAVSRPIMALAPAWGFVLVARLVDRVGKALRTAPRDALIADSTPPELRGAAFGYHRALDTVGGVLGPLAAFALLAADVRLRVVIACSIVPAVAALVLLRRVHEPPAKQPQPPPVRSFVPARLLPRRFWIVLGMLVVFSVGNSADTFLILRANDLGLSVSLTVLAYALFNTTNALLSWPLGALSDRVPRVRLLVAGLLVFALVYGGLAWADTSWVVWPLFALYGCYLAATDGVARAFVADYAPREAGGTAYGIYAAALGGAALVASVTAGILWTEIGPRAPFVLGALTALLGAALLATQMRRAPP